MQRGGRNMDKFVTFELLRVSILHYTMPIGNIPYVAI